MSAEEPARPDELLVDEERERSAALALGLGALLVVVLVAAQVGVQEAGTSVTAAAGPVATADPATADPATADPATADPATADPATADPATADPAPADTAPADPGSVATDVVPAPAASTVPFAAAPPPAEPPLTDPRSVALAEQLALAGDVIFDPVTGEPTETRTAVLDDVAAAVQEYGDIPVTIVGHAAPSDDTAAEQAIALQRAQDVSLFLRLRMVPADLLRIASAGATEAAAADPTAGNSRVSFRVLPAD